jgi:hypothetical protein
MVLTEIMQEGFRSILLGVGQALLVLAILLGIGLLLYHLFFSFMLWKLAKELHVKHRWLAWIPLLNLNVIFMCGNVNPWWTLLIWLMIIPGLREIISFVLLMLSIIAFWNIAEKRGYPRITSLLIVFPVFNIILLFFYTFFSRKKKRRKHK